MSHTFLETPTHLFEAFFTKDGAWVSLTHKPSKRGVMLTSEETECFLTDFNNWHESMTPEYLAAMLWEVHAAPIINHIEGKE